MDVVESIKQGDRRALARLISLIENESSGYEQVLEQLHSGKNIPVIGFTGPPGAGKSTLINAYAKHLAQLERKVAILAVDPSSPFTRGAIMGDRLRMSEHFLHPSVFIRSMATRGSLGGLAPKVFEVCDVLKAAGFDYILIETVGVGQSEVEIAALADTTILVLVPEAGDDIQALKSGIMEIADIYVVNKSDREAADVFYRNLLTMVHSKTREAGEWENPVLQTTASQEQGVAALHHAIEDHERQSHREQHRSRLLAEKALMLIKEKRTKDISLPLIEHEIQQQLQKQNFNLYRFVKQYT